MTSDWIRIVGVGVLHAALACGCGIGDGDRNAKFASVVDPCVVGAVTKGDHAWKIAFDDEERSYVLHVPSGYAGTTHVPLVVNFHGYTSDGAQQEAFSAMDATSDAEGFVVAYPNGIASSWNGGLCCGDAASKNVDDVGFARALVKEIEARVCIDAKRVYATGMSNGGFLAHRLGCEAADLFAAIAPVASVLGISETTCKPVRPMPVIHFHGTADGVVHYEGGGGLDSVVETFAGWATRDGCTDIPKTTFRNKTASCVTHEACSDGVHVTLCTLRGEGHCWPGQSVCPGGAATTDLSANQEMWKFFRAYALP